MEALNITVASGSEAQPLHPLVQLAATVKKLASDLQTLGACQGNQSLLHSPHLRVKDSGSIRQTSTSRAVAASCHCLPGNGIHLATVGYYA